MKKCLIVGAGGAGREALAWALAIRQSEWRIEGFLDANPGSLEGKNTGFPIVGNPSDWVPSSDEVFVSGLGDPATRLRLCGELARRGANFISIIHPSVTVAMETTIGVGCVIAPHAVVSVNVRIEPFVLINLAATLGHDSIVSEGATISCHCDVMGYAQVGRGAFLGSHACILPGVKVGEFAVVGAGSSVVRNVAARTTVMGVPAQLLFKHQA